MQPILQVSSDQLVPFVLVVGDQQGCGGELGVAPQEVWAWSLIGEGDLNQDWQDVGLENGKHAMYSSGGIGQKKT